jgi:2-methylcitrate dehydratase PrpD
VIAEPDASLDVGAARMTVHLTDGGVLAERVAAARGTAANPLTPEEVEGKFRRLAGVVLPPRRVDQLLAKFGGLADLPDVAELGALAAPPIMRAGGRAGV